MKIHKKILILILSVLGICFSEVQAQEGPLEFRYLTKTSPSNQILMRWMPSDSAKWNATTRASTGSFRLIRKKYNTAIIEGVTPLETITINDLKRINAEDDKNNGEWLSNWNDGFYQLLFNSYYQQFTNTNPRDVISAQLTERYFMASLAADVRYNAAKLAGLGYTDFNVTSGFYYTYTIEILNGATPASVIETYTSAPIQVQNTVLPLPKGLKTVKNTSSKGRVILKWGVTNNEDDASERNTYAAYYVERAEKAVNSNTWSSFTRLTKDSQGASIPYINFTGLNANYYSDSVLNENKSYRYRVIGISFFGDEITSATLDTTIYSELKLVPGFTGIKKVGTNYDINWKFPINETTVTSPLDLINGYVIHVSKTDSTFKNTTAITGILSKTLTTYQIPASSITTVSKDSSFYFKIGAIGIGGDTTYSYSYIILPEDNGPPAMPTGLTVTPTKTTTEYQVKLTWNANTEPDLLGYQIYRQVGNETEKIFLGKGIRNVREVIDTLTVNMEFPLLKYTLIAYDQNYNPSQPATITHQKPDTRRPMPAIIKKHGFNSNGKVQLEFEFSPEKSGLGKSIEHEIIRKELTDASCNFSTISVIANNVAGNTYVDLTSQAGKTYVYSILAYDQTNNRSCYKNPGLAPSTTPRNVHTECNECYQIYVVSVPDTARRPAPNPFTATVSDEGKTIQLDWAYNQEKVQEFEIYRGSLTPTLEKPSLLKIVEAIDTPTLTNYTFTDEKVEYGKSYKYLIRAVFSTGQVSFWKELTTPVLTDRTLELDKYDLTLSTLSQSTPITVTSNTAWTITTTDNTWLTTSATSGANNGVFNVIVTQNTTNEDRTGTIRVNSNSITRDINVRQVKVPNGTGLTAKYYSYGTAGNDTTIINSRTADVIRIDPQIDFSFSNEPAPGLSYDFAVVWEGFLEVPTSGTYSFFAKMDDGMRIWINDEELINTNVGNFSTEIAGIKTLQLSVGQRYNIKVKAWDSGGLGAFKLLWSNDKGLSKQVIPQQYLYPISVPDAKDLDVLHNKCFVIRNTDNDRILQMMNNYTVTFAPYSGKKDQIWKFEKSDNYYKIISQIDNQGKILEAFISTGNTGSRIVTTGFFSDKFSQKWSLTRTQNERYTIKQLGTLYNLDMWDDGTFRTITYDGSGKDFKFESVACPTNTSSLSVDRNLIVFGSAGGTEALNITTEKYWIATPNENWMGISPHNDYGNKTINISTAPLGNGETKAKYGNIVIKGESSSITVSVKQAAPPNGTGLTGKYFNVTGFTAMNTAEPTLIRIDEKVDFSWAGSPGPTMNNDFSTRWEGYVEAPISGNYTFYTASDDGVRFWINNDQLINNDSQHSEMEFTANKVIYLQAGQKYPIKMEFWDGSGSGAARLKWSNDKGMIKQIIQKQYLYPLDTKLKIPCVGILQITRNTKMPTGQITIDKACEEINLDEGFESDDNTEYSAEIEN